MTHFRPKLPLRTCGSPNAADNDLWHMRELRRALARLTCELCHHEAVFTSEERCRPRNGERMRFLVRAFASHALGEATGPATTGTALSAKHDPRDRRSQLGERRERIA